MDQQIPARVRKQLRIIQKIDRIANITSGHLEMGNHLSECYMLARQLYIS